MDKTTRLLLRALDNIGYGRCRLTLDNGQSYQFEGANPGPDAHMQIHEPSMLKSVIVGGDIAFAEAYRLGHWDSDDIASLVEFVLLNEATLQPFIFGQKLKQWLAQIRYLFRRNTLKGSRKNIHAHYDLGNDFYALWLDESMTYSSALFVDGDESLYQAQQQKYDRILSALADNAIGDKALLEIGCGWGGFAERCLSQTDCRLKSITISPAQLAFAKKRLRPYDDRAIIALEDYRKQNKQYDGIVSIEMFEAVGENYWQTYFSQIQASLKPKGQAVIQTITIDDNHFETYRKTGDAIRSFIFPGGMLPSQERFIQAANEAGLQVMDQYFFGQDYAKTLLLWLSRFDAQAQTISAHYLSPDFIRLWRFYLAYCAGAFKAGRTNVMQAVLCRA